MEGAADWSKGVAMIAGIVESRYLERNRKRERERLLGRKERRWWWL